MSIIEYAITDERSLRAVVKILKQQNPDVERVHVPPKLWYALWGKNDYIFQTDKDGILGIIVDELRVMRGQK